MHRNRKELRLDHHRHIPTVGTVSVPSASIMSGQVELFLCNVDLQCRHTQPAHFCQRFYCGQETPVRPLSTLAAASMWILITHFTLWPIYVERLALLPAYAATLASGVLVALTVTWATRSISGVPQFHRNHRPAGGQACSPAALVA